MKDRRLRIVLWVAGVGCGISFLGVFVPWSWLEGWMTAWGVAAVPAAPVFVYCLRVGCATWGFAGLYFLILATNPTAYAPFLNLAIAGAMVLGLVALQRNSAIFHLTCCAGRCMM